MAPKNSVAAYDKEIAALEHELWCSKHIKAGGQKPDQAKTRTIEAALSLARANRNAALRGKAEQSKPETTAEAADVETASA